MREGVHTCHAPGSVRKRTRPLNTCVKELDGPVLLVVLVAKAEARDAHGEASLRLLEARGTMPCEALASRTCRV